MQEQIWWRMYGPFDAGEDDLPHMGQLIRHFCKAQGFSTRELAERLTQLGWKVGERRMEQLLSDDNTSDPQQISRRKLLARALSIPPILLGLAQIPGAQAAVDTLVSVAKHAFNLDADALVRYDAILATYWDCFYNGSIRNSAQGIKQWRRHIEELSKDADPTSRPHTLTLLCRFDQLAAVVARDEGDLVSAMHYHNQSLRVAKQLDNPELLAAGLFRRARTSLHQGRTEKALQDMALAVRLARGARDNLRGYVYQMAGVTITLLPPTNETREQFRRFMHEAARILRKGAVEDDGSGVQFNASGYYQDRARGCLRLNDTDGALSAITFAEKAQSSLVARWQVELLTLRAHAYSLSGELEWACEQLEEAIVLVRASNSATKKRKIRQTFELIAARYPQQPEVRQLAAFMQG
jgi:tetratricopeptide (TPR) repeat protein